MSISVIHRFPWHGRVHPHLRRWHHLTPTTHTPSGHVSHLLLKLLYLLLRRGLLASMVILRLVKVHGQGDQVVMVVVLLLILIQVLVFLHEHLSCR
jgi:hypothetical protein